MLKKPHAEMPAGQRSTAPGSSPYPTRDTGGRSRFASPAGVAEPAFLRPGGAQQIRHAVVALVTFVLVDNLLVFLGRCQVVASSSVIREPFGRDLLDRATGPVSGTLERCVRLILCGEAAVSIRIALGRRWRDVVLPHLRGDERLHDPGIGQASGPARHLRLCRQRCGQHHHGDTTDQGHRGLLASTDHVSSLITGNVGRSARTIVETS
jgi:hypothetical protein